MYFDDDAAESGVSIKRYSMSKGETNTTATQDYSNQAFDRTIPEQSTDTDFN